MLAIFNEKIEMRERCKGVHCVDLGESFPTSLYLQNFVSIQPRTSRVKFAASRDKPGRKLERFSAGQQVRPEHLPTAAPRYPVAQEGKEAGRMKKEGEQLRAAISIYILVAAQKWIVSRAGVYEWIRVGLCLV